MFVFSESQAGFVSDKSHAAFSGSLVGLIYSLSSPGQVSTRKCCHLGLCLLSVREKAWQLSPLSLQLVTCCGLRLALRERSQRSHDYFLKGSLQKGQCCQTLDGIINCKLRNIEVRSLQCEGAAGNHVLSRSQEVTCQSRKIQNNTQVFFIFLFRK